MNVESRAGVLRCWLALVAFDTVSCTIAYAGLWLCLVDTPLDVASLSLVAGLFLVVKSTVWPQHWIVLSRALGSAFWTRWSPPAPTVGFQVSSLALGYAVFLAVLWLSVGPTRPVQFLELVYRMWFAFADPLSLLKPAALLGTLLCALFTRKVSRRMCSYSPEASVLAKR